ncbi:hypothetical protein NPX13_g5991 [Xylaria arbuscula]|uniref:Uncharacterized protein n=1 Tax=Xylaria arbuscula TaxID=114810 RepID=A0A9W8NDC6_9PEZI|nr:hypothetical protein NPX13_g5991 [Xylaria arbuscula]
MDHIPPICGSPYQHIRVPNFCTEPYDGLEFSGYPQRKGWADPVDGSLALSKRSHEARTAFLQTWLFFGVLEEVLGCRIDLGDFVKDGYITTAQLPLHTEAWHGRLLEMSDADRRKQYLTAQACLETARSQCILLLDETATDCPLPSEIYLPLHQDPGRISEQRHAPDLSSDNACFP